MDVLYTMLERIASALEKANALHEEQEARFRKTEDPDELVALFEMQEIARQRALAKVQDPPDRPQ